MDSGGRVQKNKTMMRLERSGSVGMGIHVWMKKNKRKNQEKEKEKKNVYGKKVKRIIVLLNGTIIFSQYVTINLK